MKATPTDGVDFENLFELAPVSLWIEDYSKLKRVLDQWRAEGVTDLCAYLREDPSRKQCFLGSVEILQVNQFTLDLFRAPNQASLLAHMNDFLRDELTQNLELELSSLWEGNLGYEKRSVNYDLQGRKLDVMVNMRILPGYEQDWSRTLLSLKDVTAEAESTRRLQLSEQYARDLFEQSPVALLVQDFSDVKRMLDEVRAAGVQDLQRYLQTQPEFIGRCIASIGIVEANCQSLQLLGVQSRQDLQDNLLSILNAQVHDAFSQQLQYLWEGNLAYQCEVVNYPLSRTKLHLHLQFAVMTSHAETWDRVLISLIDITERKKHEVHLKYLSQHDVLTQLYSRTFYIETLERIKRHGPWPLALIAIDMNGLKEINDLEGHAAGDARLCRMGDVLTAAVPEGSYAARIGGDEFMVLLPGMGMSVAQQVQDRILSVLAVNNERHPQAPIRVAMGLACCQEGEALEACIHAADKAMYREKQSYYQRLGHDRRSTARTEAP